MTDRLLTPTKITAWLDCPHYLTLAHEAERGARDGRAATRQPGRAFGSMARTTAGIAMSLDGAGRTNPAGAGSA